MFFNHKPKDPVAKTLPRYQALLEKKNLSQATFAGGCFWCLEGPLVAIDGVSDVIAGYAGGKDSTPTYQELSRNQTDHRESVQVFFNPQITTYQQLLDVFWLQIDPTDPDGQFADRGHQYTTAIFYHSDQQKLLAEKSKAKLELSRLHNKPIVTSILPFTTFYPAEDYHQHFYLEHAPEYERYAWLSGRKAFIDNIKKQAQKETL